MHGKHIQDKCQLENLLKEQNIVEYSSLNCNYTEEKLQLDKEIFNKDVEGIRCYIIVITYIQSSSSQLCANL